KERDG
ncbi:Protein of unknown function, partial [Gryllus bimaculatus]